MDSYRDRPPGLGPVQWPGDREDDREDDRDDEREDDRDDEREDVSRLVERLAMAGCVAPEEEAEEMVAASGADAGRLGEMVARREAGEPLAWVTGSVVFAGLRVAVAPGVYVPRAQSELVVGAALEVLPAAGVVADLCTGSGAVAAAIGRARPDATVLAADIDPVACRCARRNGVTVYEGDMDTALPAGVRGRVDVLIAVAPYVPEGQIQFLPRDFRDWEPRVAIDGGSDGLAVVRRVVAAAAGLLRPGGYLVVELGGDQDRLLGTDLGAAGFETPARSFHDRDGDLRAVRARRSAPSG